jgi:hypothetical protein
MISTTDDLGSLQQAQRQFRQMNRLAAIQTFFKRVIGRCAELCSFDEAIKAFRGAVMGQRKLQDICLGKIIGSVGRFRDYTPDFLPKISSDEYRWVQVNRAINGFSGVPPIEVYHLGDHYFVQDGHHRVSVLKSMGVPYVEAYVTEVYPAEQKEVSTPRATSLCT